MELHAPVRLARAEASLLSISVAEFEVILVGREINGKNDLENIMSNIHLFCRETDASLSLYSNHP